MPADGGGSAASATRNQIPVAEVFEARKQVGVGELHERVKKAVESSSGNAEEIVRNVMMLATEGADDIKNNLEKIHAAFKEDKEVSFIASSRIGRELEEKIKELENGPKEAVQEAFQRFEIQLNQIIKETLPSDVKEVAMKAPSEAVSALDEKIEALQSEVDDLERRKKRNKNGEEEPPLLPEEEAELAAKQAEIERLEAKSRELEGKTEKPKPAGIPASFAESARKIQEKNAAEAEAKLGSFIDGLIEKARKERTKYATAFPSSEGEQRIASARFEADKSVLSARHLLHFIEGDKRTRRRDAEDPSGTDEYEVYQAAPSGFSEKGVLNLARNKFGYSGEDMEVLESIQKKAQEQLSSEKEGGTGDFAKGVATAEKRISEREEIDRISKELNSFGAQPSEADKKRIEELKARREELLSSLSGVSFKAASKKGDEAAPVANVGNSEGRREQSLSPLSEGEQAKWSATLKEHQALLLDAEALRGQWEGSTEIDTDVEGWLQWGRSLVDAERSFLDSKTQDDRSVRGRMLLEALKGRPTNAKALDTVIQRVRGEADKLETDSSKGIADKKEAEAAQAFVEAHFNKRTDAYNKVKIKKEKIDAMVAELGVSLGSAGAAQPAEASPDVSKTPDGVPPTPDVQPPAEIFTGAEQKEMSDKIASGERVIAEAETMIAALESSDPVSDEQKGEVEWVKGGYKTLIDVYRDLSRAKTVEEKAKAEDRYETAKAVIGDKAQREVILGIRDGLTGALKETAAKILATKAPEIQTQEKVLRNYAKALKALVEGMSEHVPEIGSITVDVPELTVIPPEQSPDPAASKDTPPAADTPPTPDKPPVAPEALSAFEKIVAEDEARLTEVKTAMGEWGKGMGERPPQDADIQRVVDVYEAAIKAERAYIAATTQVERDMQWAQVRLADKAVPKARASLDKLTKDFLLYARKADGPDGYVKEAWGPAWKETVLSRTAVLNVLSGMLKKIDQPAKAPKPADAAPVVSPDVSKTSTPDVAPSATPDAGSVAPPATPDASKTPDKPPTPPVEKTLGEKAADEEALLLKLEGLLDKMVEVKELDATGSETKYGDLGEVLLRAQEGVELLEQASKEQGAIKRQDLLVKREVLLHDPNMLSKAEVYMRRMALFMRGTSPEEMEGDTQLATRMEALEVLSQLFPDLAKKIGVLKTKKQEAATLDFVERRGWEQWVAENGKRLESVREALKKATEDSWYKKNQTFIETGLAFQEGVLARTKAVLAAKTPQERQNLDRELVEFRRQAREVPKLIPGQSKEQVLASIKQIEEEREALKVGDEGDKEERKKAKEKKQEQIQELKRLLSVLELDEDIQQESGLHTMRTEKEIAAEIQRRREINAMRPEGAARIGESAEDVYAQTESEAGEHHEEMRERTSAAKAARNTFLESLARYNPHEETGKLFSPIYEAWNEEQAATFELLVEEREAGFRDHLEVWATKGLRMLDSKDSQEILTDEAWHSLTADAGAERMFAKMTLDPNERKVEAIKARLYDVMRKVTQEKIQGQEKRLQAEREARDLAGSTKERLEEARATIEATLEKATTEWKRISNTIATMQSPPEKGGNAIRWKREGDALLAQQSILGYAVENAKDRKADFEELAKALTESEGSSSEAQGEAMLPFTLQEGVNARLAAIMKKQTERGQTTEKTRTQAVQGIYKASPQMMNVEIRSTSSGKMGGEIKRESIGGGTAPEGAYASFKKSWAGKLMSPFLSMFEGLFK